MITFYTMWRRGADRYPGRFATNREQRASFLALPPSQPLAVSPVSEARTALSGLRLVSYPYMVL